MPIFETGEAERFGVIPPPWLGGEPGSLDKWGAAWERWSERRHPPQSNDEWFEVTLSGLRDLVAKKRMEPSAPDADPENVALPIMVLQHLEDAKRFADSCRSMAALRAAFMAGYHFHEYKSIPQRAKARHGTNFPKGNDVPRKNTKSGSLQEVMEAFPDVNGDLRAATELAEVLRQAGVLRFEENGLVINWEGKTLQWKSGASFDNAVARIRNPGK